MLFVPAVGVAIVPRQTVKTGINVEAIITFIIFVIVEKYWFQKCESLENKMGQNWAKLSSSWD